MNNRKVPTAFAFILLFSLILFWACTDEPSDSRPPTISPLKEIVAAGKIPSKSQLSNHHKTIQDIFKPLAAVAEKPLGIVYVSVSGGSTAKDGTSWETAYANPKTAIDEAGTKTTNEKPYLVLLAGGTYPLSATLNMKNNVVIVGGITSTFLASKTTLDGGGTQQVFDNIGLANTAVLYGVTITKGKAKNGGGMYNTNSSPTLSQVTFSANSATRDGGGMYNNSSSSPTLSQVTFSANSATTVGGGGMYNNNSSPTINQVTFSANSATRVGGGIYNNNSSPTLSQVTFSANTTADSGGGMYNFDSSPTLSQVTFFANSATTSGGGMYNDNNGKTGPTIINGIFGGNTQGTNKDASQIYIDKNGPLQENLQIYYSIVQGADDAQRFLQSLSGNAEVTITQHSVSGTDPKLSALAGNGGYVQTMALGSGSPAINKGIYVRKKGTTYYYSENASTWYTAFKTDNTGFDTSKSASLPAGVINLTASDARGYGITGRPDLGAYEFGGTAP